jgi:hypothetical protein
LVRKFHGKVSLKKTKCDWEDNFKLSSRNGAWRYELHPISCVKGAVTDFSNKGDDASGFTKRGDFLNRPIAEHPVP